MFANQTPLFVQSTLSGAHIYGTHSDQLKFNSNTMACPPVRGDNPQTLASGLSYVQVDTHDITILYHIQQCRPCTSRDILC